jgi:hypothetical protein
VTLAEVKQYLRQIHDDDDDLLQSLIDGAEREALAFLGSDTLEVDETDIDAPSVPADVISAIKMLVRADYEATDPEVANAWRKCAEIKMYPYRSGLGV